MQGHQDDPRSNRGVLLIVAPSERQSRIELAEGARAFFGDSASGVVQGTAMVPDFRAGNYGRGLLRGVDAVARAFANRFGFALESSARSVRPIQREEARGIASDARCRAACSDPRVN
jgi:uncharacterized protein